MQPDLTPSLVLNAYARGIFPMAESREDDGLFWLDPEIRGIIPLDNFHISRSLRKEILRERYRVTIDQDFAGVIEGCADRLETWINGPIFGLYMDLFRTGHAHSVEVWDGDALIGGVYGIALKGAFFGESMFSRRTNASKISLAYLVSRLRAGGFTLFDTQFPSPHLSSLGGVQVPRERYKRLLKGALKGEANFLRQPQTVSGHQVCSE